MAETSAEKGITAPTNDDPLPPEKEALVMKIITICWEQFGRGANVTISDDCYDQAVIMGALSSLRARLSKQEVFTPKELKDAKFCSIRAGRVAGDLARKEKKPGFLPVVSATNFEAAFKVIKDDVEENNKRRRDDGKAHIEAVYC